MFLWLNDPIVRMRIRNIVISLFIVAAAVVVYLYIESRNAAKQDNISKKRKEAASVVNSTQNSNPESGNLDSNKANNADFDRRVARSNADQLKYQLNRLKLEFREVNSIAKKNDILNKQIQLANRILETNKADEALFGNAVGSKLNAHIAKELLAIQENVSTEKDRKVLEQVAENYLDNQNADIAALAAVADTLNSISGLVAATPNEQSELLDISKDKFREAATNNKSNAVVARHLFGFLNLIWNSRAKSASQDFFKIFSDVYRNSDNEVMVNMAKIARNGFEITDIELADIANAVKGEKNELVDLLLNQIETAVSQTGFSEGNASMIIGRIVDLVRIDRVDSAKLVLKKLREAILKNELDKDLLKRLDEIASQLRKIGTKFEFDGLLNPIGGPMQLQYVDARQKILLFVSNSTIKDSVQLLEELIRTIGPFVTNLEIEVVMIIRGKQDEKSLAQIAEFGKKYYYINTCHVPPGSDAEKFIEKTVPMLPVPGFVVLDDQDRIRSIFPTNSTLIEIAFEEK